MWSIWTKNRLDFTLIWDNVNITSRLESKTREVDGNIVISKDYYDKINFENSFKSIWLHSLKWKNNQIELYYM